MSRVCDCDEPLLDGDVGVDGDNAWCWRCHAPLAEEDDDE